MELVSQVIDIDDHQRAIPTIPDLELEYASWQDWYNILKARIEAREAERKRKEAEREAGGERGRWGRRVGV